MRITVWSETVVFKLTAMGGGIGFELLHKPSNRSVFVQDDDALQFEEEFEAFGGGGTDALEPLWSIYSEVATTFEERMK